MFFFIQMWILSLKIAVLRCKIEDFFLPKINKAQWIIKLNKFSFIALNAFVAPKKFCFIPVKHNFKNINFLVLNKVYFIDKYFFLLWKCSILAPKWSFAASLSFKKPFSSSKKHLNFPKQCIWWQKKIFLFSQNTIFV